MATLFLTLLYLLTFLFALILGLILPFSPLSNKNGIPRHWPVLGSFPAIMGHFHHLMDWITVVVNETGHSTFRVKGPWYSNLNLLITVDPADVQYTSSSRFSNFPRGPKSRVIFDVFGAGYFNMDSKEWVAHRKIHRSFFSQKQFVDGSTGLAFEKVEKGIAVVLDHVAAGGRLAGGEAGVVDLQDLFLRFTYDLTHRFMIGYDPHSLSLEWSQALFSKAMNSAMEGAWMRHILPEPIWKLQRQLGIGQEKAFNKAKDFLHKFSTKVVSTKHDEFNKRGSMIQGDEKFNDMLTTYMIEDERYRLGEGEEVLSGSLLSLMFAGKDTTSAAMTWFFWVLSQHPSTRAKIRDEIAGVIPKEKREKPHVFTPEEISKLVYLHAAVCETLRLYPPIPFQSRTPRELDVLPSGFEVIPNSTMVIIPLYAMARTVKVWGEDCAEFKPERWITEDGGLKHEPSHKFFSFNCGPRICLGREVALNQIKVVAATILHNYDVQVLPEPKVVPVYSIALQTKYGFRARVTKRCE